MSGHPKPFFSKLVLTVVMLINGALLLYLLVFLYGHFFIQEQVAETEIDIVYEGEPLKKEDIFPEEPEEYEKYAGVAVTSRPTGAMIYVQGHLKGITPADIVVVAATEDNKYRLALVKEGYEKWEKDIYLKQGEKKEITAFLKALK